MRELRCPSTGRKHHPLNFKIEGGKLICCYCGFIKPRVTALAFLQNQYFSDPEKVREMIARRPGSRRNYIARFLFAGCLTGKRLAEIFGWPLCAHIVWEEASPEIGGESSSAFPTDPVHIAKTIEEIKPDVILFFGKIAQDGLRAIAVENDGLNYELRTATGIYHAKVLTGPHPTARGVETLRKLRKMKRDLDDIKTCFEVADEIDEFERGEGDKDDHYERSNHEPGFQVDH